MLRPLRVTPMPASKRKPTRLLALAVLLFGALALSAQQPKDDPLKKLEPQPKIEPKADAKDAKDTKPLVVKLPDGTFLWLGGASDGERVTLTPQEFQKLLDRVDALKKELAARKPTPPSGCAIRGTVQKRGEQLVAALKLTYSFRTTQPNTAVALGARRAFLVGAALDGAKLPVLDTGDDGFAVTVESAGDHKLVLDVEAPVTARGAKTEVGFDLGLPRAPITTLALDPPPGDVKRVNLTTRTTEPPPAKTPEPRRLVGVDVKQLAKGGDGLPLGAVDSLEVAWDPPAGGTQPADQVQSAEIDVGVVLTEGFVESTAKVKLRGSRLDWKLVAPSTADVSVDRVAGTASETGPTLQPTVTKPTDGAKLVWKVELPVGSSAADWIVTAVVRQARPKGGPKSAPTAIGPFAVLDALRQTGTVKITAGPHTRFVFRHGPDLRRAEATGPAEDDRSTAQFRLTTGPTGTTAVNAPLLTVEAWPVEGAVRVKPTYKLKLTEAGWRVTAEIAVKPIRTEIDTLTIDVPTEWRGLESESDPEVVEGVTQGKVEGSWQPVTVRLVDKFKQPFTVVLVGTVPVPPGGRDAVIPLPKFPRAVERDATATATVPEGLEVHGTARGWDGDTPAAWSTPLFAVPGADGKVPKAVTAVSGKGERGLARVALTWQPYRPDVTADVRTEVTIGERQVVVSQVIKLRSPDGLPKTIRLRGPAEALGLKATPPLDAPAAGVWSFAPPGDAKDVTLRVSFALPLPQADGPLPLPVGLLWPTETARVEANVRVWVNSVTGRTVAAPAAGWRSLPAEPAPDRDSLPALTLSASAEHPLVLEVRHASPDSAAAVWVERALIEAGMNDDGSVGYRARFRLLRWLTPAVEVSLPDAVGPNPTARLDGVIAALVPVGAGDGFRQFRVALPDGANGRTVILDVQYTLPGTRHTFGETTYEPPRITGAAHAGATRWLITEPGDAAPLQFSGRAKAEIRWRWRTITYAPTATSRAALDRWFTNGTEPGPGDLASTAENEPLVVRQTAPERVRIVRVPWLALVIGCSLFVFVVVVALTWLRTWVACLLVAVLGGAFGVGVVLYPQPAVQIIAAGQPGFVLALVAVAVQTVILWLVRRRVTHLPGFTRTPPAPSELTGPSTAKGGSAPPSAPSSRNRTGSSGTPTPAPSGT
jgi:hypothetical protein